MSKKSVLILCALALTASIARAEASKWQLAEDGSWSDEAKWSHGVPTSALDAVIDVEGSPFTVTMPTAPSAANITIGQNAIVDLTAAASRLITADAGQVIVRDSARVNLSNAEEGWRLGVGRTEFSGNAVFDLKAGGTVYFGGHNHSLFSAVTETEIVFRDHARLTANSTAYPGCLAIVNAGKVMTTTLRYESDQPGLLGAATFIGWGRGGNGNKGTGRLIQSSGYLQTGGQWGLHAGLMSNLSGQSFCVTGIVQISGGAYMVRASKGSDDSNYFIGAIFGRGRCLGQAAKAVPDAYGELNISGNGIFTNQTGYLVFGVGNGRGVFRQTGGELQYASGFRQMPTILGFAGGDGEYSLSNGIARLSNDFYVGGAPNDIAKNYTSQSQSTEDTDTTYATPATGRFVIAPNDPDLPCAIDCSSTTLHVGYNGTGEVEIGEGAAVVARYVILHGASSTLKFSLGKTGRLGKTVDGDAARSLLRASNSNYGTITIEEGAKLVVNAHEFESTTKEAWVPLITAAKTLVGSFADENITVTVGEGTGEIVQDRPGYANTIWFHYRRPKTGLMLLFR